MTRMQFSPLLFLLTGLLWLLAASVVGMALFLSMVLGQPIPAFLRQFHVHGALVGGVVQVIVGVMLASGERSKSHPILFTAINVSAIGMLVGLRLGYSILVVTAGLLVLVALLSLLGDAIRHVRTSLVSLPLNLWFYGVALLALLGGMGVGEAMAMQLIPSGGIGHARLAHIHLNLLGFVMLTIVGAMHELFPTVLNGRLHSLFLARMTFALLPLGFLILVGGFLRTQLWIEIAGGVFILAGTAMYSYNIARSWSDAGRPRKASADHFTQATFFLAATVITGLLVAMNYLPASPEMPTYMPFGKLHLVAYTHLALIGFILHTIFGALSHLLPTMLAVERAQSNKKRGQYVQELTSIIERWRSVQVGALSLGTMGLALVASLVWKYNLTSLRVQLATWMSLGLLVLSFTLFAGKIGLLLARRPPE